MEINFKFLLITTTFLASLITSLIAAPKIGLFIGIPVTAATVSWCLTFPMTDVICEVWGRKKAGKVVFLGFLSLILVTVLITIIRFIPAAPFYTENEAFNSIFSITPRILIAGWIAYILSQTHDVFAFSLFKKLTKDKYLWLRNNLSTIVSQFIDSVSFTTIAFLGKYPFANILQIVFGVYIMKIIIAICDTPFVYLLVRWVKNKWKY
ncbi:MAG: queuosine precursor transporter [Candidatus Woesearchaeota archaeon]|nr:MAG: queuosine precursor transporter [Candidatus Woesearchaeota archaeon]